MEVHKKFLKALKKKGVGYDGVEIIDKDGDSMWVAGTQEVCPINNKFCKNNCETWGVKGKPTTLVRCLKNNNDIPEAHMGLQFSDK